MEIQSLAQLTSLNGDRVREHTAPAVNDRIDRMTQAQVDAAIVGGPPALVRRMTKLDTEWDIDRTLMVNFALAGAVSLGTGLLRYRLSSPFRPRRKGFLYFFGAQLGFLLLHGTLGWCPPASLFRRLGFRTQREIELERRQLADALELTNAA